MELLLLLIFIFPLNPHGLICHKIYLPKVSRYTESFSVDKGPTSTRHRLLKE